MSSSFTRASTPQHSTNIWWIRRDLRLHDNAALISAVTGCNHLVPCYVLDPRELEPRRSREQGGLGVPKLGPHRCRFILESLRSLKQQLLEQGSDLVFHVGRPEVFIPEIARQLASEHEALQHVSLHSHSDVMPESAQLEQDVQTALEAAMKQTGVSTSSHWHWGLTLYQPEDLPSAAPSHAPSSNAQPAALRYSPHVCAGVAGVPDVMTQFRKAVLQTPMRSAQPMPRVFPPLPSSFQQPQAGGEQADPASSPAGAAPIPSSQLLTCGSLPSSALDLYVQAGTAATGALQTLCTVTGMDCATFESPGRFDSRSAFRLRAGPDGGMERLLSYTRGSSSSSSSSGDGGVAQSASTASHPLGQHHQAPGTIGHCQGSMEAASQQQPSSVSVATPDPHAQPSYLPLRDFVDTRALAHGQDNSTKLSPFLAQGCLSARQVHEEVCSVREGAERLGVPHAACDQLFMHLQIRDHYLLTALKHGSAVLEAGGLKGQDRQWGHDEELFAKWAQGKTGIPFVDACMLELAATGWMSNRGRQCVSSFLSKTLKQDWRLGAELFESLLVDHDLGVNWVNWNYFAGVGNDPRDRHFKVISQGIQYDEQACLISQWIPALERLPLEFKHTPFLMTDEQQQSLGCTLGLDYPWPCVDAASQIGVGPKQRRVRAQQ